MNPTRIAAVSIASLLLAAVAFAPLRGAQAAKPLTEEGLVKLIDLQLGDDAIVAKLAKDGVAYPVDDAAVGRLKAAGASDAVVVAARKAGKPRPAAGGKAITYNDVLELLKLGIPEAQVLKRLEQSPTVFTLDAAQVDELKAAGATESLLAALQGRRKAAVPVGEITDLAIILDCSASMSEATREGPAKMVVAKRVVTDLVQKLPDGLNLAFVIYGHEKQNKCEAVRVVRPAGPLDSAGKAALTRTIAQLQPVGNTPIALALRTAGSELARAKGAGGVVLITDGKETCNGDPAAEAATLAARGNLSFGVNVVGFDVEGEERAAVEEVARSGKGKYYNAESAAELRDVIQSVRKTIEVAARPIPAQSIKVRRRAVRTVKLLPPRIDLPPMADFVVVPPGAGFFDLNGLATGHRYGEEARIAMDAKVEKVDIIWSPKVGIRQRIAANLPFDESNAIEIRPEEHLGLVQVMGNGLPALDKVFLCQVEGYRHQLSPIYQESKTYGAVMAVVPGEYQLRMIPANDGRTEKLVEKLLVEPGKLIKID